MHLLHAHQTVTHAPPRAHSYGRGLFIGPSGTQRADRDYENWDKEGRSKSIKKQMMDGRNVTPSNPDPTISSRLVKLCCRVSFNRSLHERWDHSAVKGSWLFPFIILENEIRNLFQPAKILVASATPRHSGLKKTSKKKKPFSKAHMRYSSVSLSFTYTHMIVRWALQPFVKTFMDCVPLRLGENNCVSSQAGADSCYVFQQEASSPLKPSSRVFLTLWEWNTHNG